MITIWGIVSADGTVAAGSGYTVRKDSDPGVYDITFVGRNHDHSATQTDITIQVTKR